MLIELDNDQINYLLGLIYHDLATSDLDEAQVDFSDKLATSLETAQGN